MAPRPRPMADRLWPKVNKTETCWLWTGAKHPEGYGRFYRGPGLRLGAGHRVVYELMVGPIPVGHDLDHLCRVHECVNPAHLEPVTRRENLLRGATIPATHAAKTHCPHGHEYSVANTRVINGSRVCRACDRINHRKAAA